MPSCTYIEHTGSRQPVGRHIEVGERRAARQGGDGVSVPERVLGQVERVQGREAAKPKRVLDAVLAQIQLR